MPLPVISVAEMREWEQASWARGCSESEVISRVGKRVAERALALTPENASILILAGKGHNGDDARCAELHLTKRRVTLLSVRDPRQELEALATALNGQPSLIIDGLFGIGLNRPLDQRWVEYIEKVNESGIAVLAVDVPSGLDADSGETHGVAIYARETITVGAMKRGLLKTAAARFVGRLTVAADVGLSRQMPNSELLWSEAEDFQSFPPSRRVDGHKGTFGHVAVMAGSLGYHGAAVLASRGALRAMPGLVSVLCSERAYLPVASQSQAAMVHPWRQGGWLPENCSSVVIGPGLAGNDLGPDWKEFANELWQSFPMPVLVDASALQWIAPGPTPLNSRRVITPHPGEAARLLGRKAEDVQENRVEALRELSGKYGNCWVVLKGHQTLIGRSSGEVFVNSTGNPHLAQGGSGDVLSGYLGGLLAQSKLQVQPLKTLRFGVWAHGFAADHLSQKQSAWTIEDLVQTLGLSRR